MFPRNVWHRAPAPAPPGSRHNLTQEWFHPDHSEHPTHSLTVGHTPPRRGQESAMVSISHKTPVGVYDNAKLYKTGSGGWLLHRTGFAPVDAAPPSGRLLSLIRNYHKNDAGAASWMPLLDALEEEYPGHFSGHVAEHAARASS